MHTSKLRPLVLARARRQGGVITHHDIRALGGSADAPTRLSREGSLIRVHRGVYVLGGLAPDHAVSVRAALAALGPDAAASHQSAAWLQGMTAWPPVKIHVVTMVARSHLPDVVVHRSKVIVPRPYQGIPCTPPARTLVDLAATATAAELAEAMDRALSTGVTCVRDLLREITTPKGRRRGTDALRTCLRARGSIGAPKPSVLESKMARLMLRYGLPPARAEYIAGPDGEYRLDYAHPGPRVAIEVHGYLVHHSPEQMKRDHARQRKLTLDGWKVLVFTWLDVVEEPARVAKEIRQVLAQAGGVSVRRGG